MRVRVKKGFVIGPGRLARPGDILDIQRDEVRIGGAVVYRGPAIHPSLYEPISEGDVATRETHPKHRDPAVTNRDPRPRRTRDLDEEEIER